MIFIAVGANLDHPEHGGPRAICEAALEVLGNNPDEPGVTVTRISRWYESAPVPASDQPWFINAVAEVETELGAAELMALLHEIEARFGRVRGAKNAARTLDLDLVDYHGEVSAAHVTPNLPHPRLSERAFVLLPLRDIAPGWRHPVSGKAIGALIDAMVGGGEIRSIP